MTTFDDAVKMGNYTLIDYGDIRLYSYPNEIFKEDLSGAKKIANGRQVLGKYNDAVYYLSENLNICSINLNTNEQLIVKEIEVVDAVQNDNIIFYICGSAVYKFDLESNSEQLIKDKIKNPRSIKYWNECIYLLASKDKPDLCRMKSDGTLLNDEYGRPSFAIYNYDNRGTLESIETFEYHIYKDRLYYIDLSSSHLYTSKLDGTDRILIVNDKICMRFNIYDDKIYIKGKDGNGDKNYKYYEYDIDDIT